MKRWFRPFPLLVVAAVALATLSAGPARADSASKIDRNARAALESLYESEPGTRQLAAKAKAILVFPNVLKAGFMFGGQYGEGALIRGGRTRAYYSTVAASYGLQVGGQVFGYAMLLMTDEALDYLSRSEGWEIGAGPSVVVVQAGTARSLTTTTLKKDVYAFIFSQKGLMAGIGLQGSKITRIRR